MFKRTSIQLFSFFRDVSRTLLAYKHEQISIAIIVEWYEGLAISHIPTNIQGESNVAAEMKAHFCFTRLAMPQVSSSAPK